MPLCAYGPALGKARVDSEASAHACLSLWNVKSSRAKTVQHPLLASSLAARLDPEAVLRRAKPSPGSRGEESRLWCWFESRSATCGLGDCGKILSFPMPRFPHLYSGANNGVHIFRK